MRGGAAREVLRVGDEDIPEGPEADPPSNEDDPVRHAPGMSQDRRGQSGRIMADGSAEKSGGGEGQGCPPGLPAEGSRSGQASTGSGRTAGDPPPSRASVDEDERICASKHRSLQITRAGERKLFGKKARKAFLGWFAATGNVVWSAEKIGFSDKTVWRHRMNDPRFAEAFDRALEQSVVRNKARMVERKVKAKPIEIDGGVGESELEDCDLEKAWPLIVEMERAKGRGGGGGSGAPIGRPRNRGRVPRAASNAQVRKELEKRLRAFGRRMRAEGKAPPLWLPPVEPRKSAKDGAEKGDSH